MLNFFILFAFLALIRLTCTVRISRGNSYSSGEIGVGVVVVPIIPAKNSFLTIENISLRHFLILLPSESIFTHCEND